MKYTTAILAFGTMAVFAQKPTTTASEAAKLDPNNPLVSIISQASATLASVEKARSTKYADIDSIISADVNQVGAVTKLIGDSPESAAIYSSIVSEFKAAESQASSIFGAVSSDAASVTSSFVSSITASPTSSRSGSDSKTSSATSSAAKQTHKGAGGKVSIEGLGVAGAAILAVAAML